MSGVHNDHEKLRRAFESHSRHWRDFQFVYPVISRRSAGVSVGVNLSPNQVCNFDCVYCQVERHAATPTPDVDPQQVGRELVALLEMRTAIFNSEEFADIPHAYQQIRDIAFSGDGEPTISPVFPEAARIVAGVRERFGLRQTKIVLLTNSMFLTRPAIVETLAFLDAHGLEVWAKLDAGTEAHFQAVNRCRGTLEDALAAILATARLRPIVIQSMFLRLHGEPPPESELTAYVARLRALVENGAQLDKVQIYTVARRVPEPYVTPLALSDLERIAVRVRELGLRAECYA